MPSGTHMYSAVSAAVSFLLEIRKLEARAHGLIELVERLGTTATHRSGFALRGSMPRRRGLQEKHAAGSSAAPAVMRSSQRVNACAPATKCGCCRARDRSRAPATSLQKHLVQQLLRLGDGTEHALAEREHRGRVPIVYPRKRVDFTALGTQHQLRVVQRRACLGQ